MGNDQQITNFSSSVSQSIKNITKKGVFYFNTKLSFRRKSYLNEIQNRREYTLTSIEELAKPISFFSAYTYELHTPNEFYGHANALKKYLKKEEDYQFKFSLEHGASTTTNISILDIDTPFSAIIVPGAKRAKFLLKYKPHTYAIGPYLHYASSLLSTDQIKSEKKRLGNNLLVFPSHSTQIVHTQFDIHDLCKKISSMGNKFDSVRICLYWKDILQGVHKIYQQYNFECVTAGHILDINFLPRLKSIIDCSSVTLSNSVGTHVGYCLYMGKPHTIMPQKLQFTGSEEQIKLIKSEYRNEGTRAVEKVCSVKSTKITQKQIEAINPYWGLDQIKSPEQLQEIIGETEAIFQQN